MKLWHVAALAGVAYLVWKNSDKIKATLGVGASSPGTPSNTTGAKISLTSAFGTKSYPTPAPTTGTKTPSVRVTVG